MSTDEHNQCYLLKKTSLKMLYIVKIQYPNDLKIAITMMSTDEDSITNARGYHFIGLSN